MTNVDCMYPDQLINIHNNTVQQYAPCRQAARIVADVPVAAVPVEAVIPWLLCQQTAPVMWERLRSVGFNHCSSPVHS